MIEARGLTKRFGQKLAVDDLTFTVRPGVVTGFLGPNGAGKSTTMRMVIGLDRPTSGSVTVNGRRYADHTDPLRQVGALLEAKGVHTSRSARNHLLALAATHGFPASRVDELIEMVGLTDVARRRAGGFSLGMAQRLGIAAALLGDPDVLILDEPVNGLDPEGVRWVRHLLKSQAAEGRTVFVSSHLMSEMAMTADHIIVIGRGRLLADAPTSEIISNASAKQVRVRTPDTARLGAALAGRGAAVTPAGGDALEVAGLSSATIGEIALEERVVLHELTPQQASLEEAFMEMTAGALEYHAGAEASPSKEEVG
ncbi:MAG TPA: ABC transporter ATP-binding protein [Acidimicrobiales bacterium]|nr:ABC transporter ATP-binding protein [Acidimicrobiales bacterium]